MRKFFFFLLVSFHSLRAAGNDEFPLIDASSRIPFFRQPVLALSETQHNEIAEKLRSIMQKELANPLVIIDDYSPSPDREKNEPDPKLSNFLQTISLDRSVYFGSSSTWEEKNKREENPKQEIKQNEVKIDEKEFASRLTKEVEFLLKNSAHKHCTEGKHCGGEPCLGFSGFHLSKNKGDGKNDFYFNKLNCTSNPQKLRFTPPAFKHTNEFSTLVEKIVHLNDFVRVNDFCIVEEEGFSYIPTDIGEFTLLNGAREEEVTVVSKQEKVETQSYTSWFYNFAAGYVSQAKNLDVTGAMNQVKKGAAKAVRTTVEDFQKQSLKSKMKKLLNPLDLASDFLATLAAEGVNAVVTLTQEKNGSSASSEVGLLLVYQEALSQYQKLMAKGDLTKEQSMAIDGLLKSTERRINQFRVWSEKKKTEEKRSEDEARRVEEQKYAYDMMNFKNNKSKDKGPPPMAPLKAVEVEDVLGDGTIQKMIEQASKAMEDANITKDQLNFFSPLLVKDLMALQQWLTLPGEVREISIADYNARRDEDLFLGSEEFFQSLNGIGSGLVSDSNDKNYIGLPNKRLRILTSGPGTGKTYNITQVVSNWVGMPICMLSGETVNAWKPTKDKDIYSMILEFIVDCVQKQSKMEVVNEDGTKSLVPFANIALFFDDFHYLYDAQKNGAFIRDPASRTKFFALMKNLGDANQSSFLKVLLAEGIEYPLNCSRLYPFMTLNEVPSEFNPKYDPKKDGESKFVTDEPTLSRFVQVNVAYPTTRDRLSIAEKHYIKIEKEILKRCEKDPGLREAYEANKEDFKAATLQSLREIAKADNDYLGGSPEKQKKGIRGYVTLLGNYLSRVLTHVGREGEVRGIHPDSSRLSSIGFNPEKEMGLITDYQITASKTLAQDENLIALDAEIKKLQKILEGPTISHSLRTELLPIFSKLSDMNKAAPKKILIDEIYKILQLPKLSLLKHGEKEGELGDVFANNFSHLQMASDSASSDDVDLFTPVWEMVESIYLKIFYAYAPEEIEKKDNTVFYLQSERPFVGVEAFVGKMANSLTMDNPLPTCSISDVAEFFPEISKDIWADFLIENSDSLDMVKKNGGTYEIDLEGGDKLLAMSDINRNYYILPKSKISPMALFSEREDKQLFFSLLRLPKVESNNYNYPWNFIDRCLSRFVNAGLSSAHEGIISLSLNKGILNTVERFRKHFSSEKPSDVRLSPTDLLLSYIQRKLNDPSSPWRKNLTVVVFGQEDSQLVAARDKVQTLKMVSPPISGRIQQAKHLFQRPLKGIVAELNKKLSSLKKLPLHESSIQVTGGEEDLLTQLQELDQNLAKFAKDNDFVLDEKILAEGVEIIHAAYRSRLDNVINQSEKAILRSASTRIISLYKTKQVNFEYEIIKRNERLEEELKQEAFRKRLLEEAEANRIKEELEQKKRLEEEKLSSTSAPAVVTVPVPVVAVPQASVSASAN